MSNKRNRTKQSSDSSSSVKSIGDLSQKFKDIESNYLQLQKFSEAQDKTIQRLIDELKKKDESIQHLETLLKNSVPTINKVERIEHSQEEIVAEAQLALIRRKAESGVELTLEEARKFEIFAKVKNNTNSKDKPLSAQFKNLSDSKPELLKLAKLPLKPDGTE